MMNKETKQTIKLAKSLVNRKLRPEDAKLLAKKAPELSRSEIKAIIHLSGYKRWLTAASKCSLELLKVAADRKTNLSACMRKDVTRAVECKAAEVRNYYSRAVECYKEYKKTVNDGQSQEKTLPVELDRAVSA